MAPLPPVRSRLIITIPATARANAPDVRQFIAAPKKTTAAAAVTAGVALMIVEPITPVVRRMPKSMAAVKPTIPNNEIATITNQSDRFARANLFVSNHVNGARTRQAISMRMHDAVKTENCCPINLLSGVALPKSAMPSKSCTTIAGVVVGLSDTMILERLNMSGFVRKS